MTPQPHSSSELQAQAGAAPLLLKPRAAADALQICMRTLAHLTSRNEIKAVRIGKSVRYDPRDLAFFIEAHKSMGTEGR